MYGKYFANKINSFKPYIFKVAVSATQGYVFGCVVGVFSQADKPVMRKVHDSGKRFAGISAVYSVVESGFELYGQKETPFSAFVSGSVAGALGACDISRGSTFTGATLLGAYSCMSVLYSEKDKK